MNNDFKLNDKSTQYFIVTAVKDEEENLQRLISSVKRQVIRPFLWVIVDDFSKDRSPQIILKAQEKLPWIYYLRLNKKMKDTHPYYAGVCIAGFNYGINYCNKHNIDYEYIGLVDADIILPKNYFYTLICNFKANPHLGIASGGLISKSGKRYKHIKMPDNLPSGAARLWRKECFQETGGYLLVTSSTDTVSNIKGQLRGWETERFENIKAIHTREISGKKGLWKGWFANGIETHYMNYHPLLVIIRGINQLVKPPFYTSLAYTFGYLSAIIKRKKQVDDEEIKRYFWNTRIKKMPKMILNQNRALLKFIGLFRHT